MSVVLPVDTYRQVALYLSIADIVAPVLQLVTLPIFALFLNVIQNAFSVTRPSLKQDMNGLMLAILALYSPLLIGGIQYLVGLPFDYFLIWATSIGYPWTTGELAASPIVQGITIIRLVSLCIIGVFQAILLGVAAYIFI